VIIGNGPITHDIGSCGVGVQRQEPPLELDELDVPVVMEHRDPHPEMKDMTVRITKERYIVFISSSQFRIC
jgi:hypothetical protein